MIHNYNTSLMEYYRARVEALVRRIEELEVELKNKNSGTNIKRQVSNNSNRIKV